MTAAEWARAVFDTTRLHGARCSYTCGCADTPEGFFKFPLCAAEFQQNCFTAGDNIDINSRKQRSVLPVNFPNKSLDPVANNGTADLFADRNPKARVSQVIGVPDNQKSFNDHFVGNAQKFQKIRTFTQSYRLGKRAAGLALCCNQENYLTAMRTARFLRPFALLRLMTRRPFLVAILTRKPWVLLRETLLG